MSIEECYQSLSRRCLMITTWRWWMLTKREWQSFYSSSFYNCCYCCSLLMSYLFIIHLLLLLLLLSQSSYQQSGSCPNGADYPIANGDVYSPNHPSDYGNDANCIYFLETYAGNALSITFDVFNTEACCDQLYIYNGPSLISPLIVKYESYYL